MELSFANKESLLAVMGKVFGWQMEHLCPPQTDWKPTTFWAGVMGAYAVSGDPQYLLAARRVGEQNSWHPGPQKRSADDHCIAQTYLEIYMADRDPRMLSPIRETFDGILRRPGDEPLVWKNAIWLREWAWCDALFMAPPAWALIYKATEERKYLDFMFQRWWKTSAFLYDP